MLYKASIDGSDWQDVTLNTPITLSSSTSTIYWRVIFIGTGAKETYIENLKMEYVRT